MTKNAILSDLEYLCPVSKITERVGIEALFFVMEEEGDRIELRLKVICDCGETHNLEWGRQKE